MRPAAGWPPAPIKPRSTVGAGDSSLAGYVRADVAGAQPPQRLQMAVAYGSGAAALPGSALPSPPRSTSTTLRSPHLAVPGPSLNRKAIPMTNPAAIIGTDLVLLDVDAGTDKESVIDRLAATRRRRRVSDRDALKAAALAREAQSATGLPGGIAIPHCRSAAVRTPSIGFARLAPKVDFGAPDGPADLVFLIAAPDGAGSEHMKLLSSLARAWSGRSSWRRCGPRNPPTNWWAWSTAWSTRRQADRRSIPAPKAAATKAKSIIAITACPTGIAHTPTWPPTR